RSSSEVALTTTMTTSCEPALGTLLCALRIDHRREEEQSDDQTADRCGVVDDDGRGGDTLRGLRGGERSEGARRAGARAAGDGKSILSAPPLRAGPPRYRVDGPTKAGRSPRAGVSRRPGCARECWNGATSATCGPRWTATRIRPRRPRLRGA